MAEKVLFLIDVDDPRATRYAKTRGLIPLGEDTLLCITVAREATGIIGL
jgi:hypothetical protein